MNEVPPNKPAYLSATHGVLKVALEPNLMPIPAIGDFN